MDRAFSLRGRSLFLNIASRSLALFLLSSHLAASQPHRPAALLEDNHGCDTLPKLHGRDAICSYLESRSQVCAPPRGFIDYTQFFYCTCGGRPLLGYTILGLWLLVLFYLLADTASSFFCPSLGGLSAALRLPPSIAGVTLLALGNSAPDVFSSIVSFAGSGAGDVGLSSLLGGAFFVSSVVVGVIGFGAGSRAGAIERISFVRDVCFFLLVLASLLAVLVIGSIGIWGSVAFVSLYVGYVVLVWGGHCCGKKKCELAVPILIDCSAAEEDLTPVEKDLEEGGRPKANSPIYDCFSWSLYLLEMPLYLPRRLTIPDMSEEKWSKPFAVASVTLAPLFLATLWLSSQREVNFSLMVSTYLFGGLVGLVLGIIAMATTEKSAPPKSCLLPWLAGGFLMGVIWSYLIAEELVSLLVSIGDIAGISHLVLGFTVLAWGNSLGDLIANTALAVNGGEDGVQIAISGCYAGPIFNTLVGLGLSLVLASWASHPAPFVLPKDSAIFQTLGFLVAGLLWAVIVLPRRGMKPDRVLGSGLLVIYLTFLCLRLLESLELVKLVL